MISLYVRSLEGDNKDGIIITVICNLEVFIATAGTNWESSSIVRVHFYDVLYVDVEFPIRFSWCPYSRCAGLTIN